MNASPQSPPQRPPLDRAEYLARFRDIVAALEQGDDSLFEQRFSRLIRDREEGLFVNLARITRELHRAVLEMSFDTQLAQYANAEIPDACLRLDYVVQVSEDAAHRTLDLVEKSRSLALQISDAAEDLGRAREHAGRYAKSPLAVTTLVEDLGHVQDRIGAATASLRENLSALAQTQEYQDLTGQVIKRVIKLVRDVESALIALLRATGAGPSSPQGTPAGGGLQGPAVPGVNSATSQQDADALLASLGF